MSQGKTTAEADNVLNTMKGTNHTAWTPYVALLTTAPAEAGTGYVEASYTGYARQPITFGAIGDDPDRTGARRITGQVSFAVTVGALDVAAVALFDAVSAGTLRRFALVAVTVPDTEAPRVEVNVVED